MTFNDLYNIHKWLEVIPRDDPAHEVLREFIGAKEHAVTFHQRIALDFVSEDDR